MGRSRTMIIVGAGLAGTTAAEAMDIRLKRAYEPAAGIRRLSRPRRPPRGVSREAARLDAWERAVAPSTELRRWFGHDPTRFEEFRRRYVAELAAQETILERAPPARAEGNGDAHLRRARHRAQRGNRAGRRPSSWNGGS